MSPAIIEAHDLSKEYHLGSIGATTLREEASRLWERWRRRTPAVDPRSLWALRDVSFEVEPGEVVGIIGRNGAGKSTLLKILSRVTEPTSGEATLRGRVASLLEVGTGFHGELTGRENVFLNGAILGMTRREIARKLDEIVEFSGVERFIDTPVKRYSSGMHVRLAFAVAAHLEPEILIVDEVLAVGDASFQKKCLNKMEDVSAQGRAVLFVSHSIPSVTRLCNRVMLLDSGRVMADGPAHEVVATYLRSGLGTSAEREWPDPVAAPGDHVTRLRRVRVRTEGGKVSAVVDIRRPVGIEIEFDVLAPERLVVPNLHFFNEEGICVFIASEVDSPWFHRPRAPGRHVVTAWIPGNFLAEGSLIVGVAISTMDPVTVHVHERDAVAFEVVDSLQGGSARGDYGGPFPGVVRPLLRWEGRREGDASEGSIA